MYITVADLREYASNLGYDLSEIDNEELEIKLNIASSYIDSLEPCLLGKRAERDQEGAFPRSSLVISGYSYGSDEIPQIVKDLQAEAAIMVHLGVDLWEVRTQPEVKSKEVVGVVKVTYAIADSQGSTFARVKRDRLNQMVRQICSYGVGILRVAVR